MRKKIVGVIGGRTCDRMVEQLAHNMGRMIANMGAVIVCGGYGGVMMAACQGAKLAQGETLGIISTDKKEDANKYCDIVIPTGLGYARNVLVVQTADVVVALPGSYGILSEIAYALQFNKPLINLSNWPIKGTKRASSLKEAERALKKLVIGKVKQ